MGDVPSKCPHIEKCEELITEAEFESVCCSILWIYCEVAKKYAEQYLKKPREWQKVKAE